MLKTVSELADKLAINKLRIYRYIKKENINATRTEKGVQYFNEVAQNDIIKHFQPTKQDTNSNANVSSDTADIIKMKNEIISRQDSEIERLYKQVESLQRTVDQQQQLELESIRTLRAKNLLSSDISNNTESEKADTEKDTANNTHSNLKRDKSSIFSRLWHSKK